MIKDILLDDFLDLEIQNGDFAVGDSTGQHFISLLSTNKGEWRFAPYLGVNLSNYVNQDQNESTIKLEIRKQCEADGANIKSINIENGKIRINGDYEQ
jgi:hypothetical protein